MEEEVIVGLRSDQEDLFFGNEHETSDFSEGTKALRKFTGE